MRLSGFCALTLLAGALRYQHHQPNWDDPRFAAYYNGKGWVTLEGVVAGYPDVRDTWTNLRVETEAITPSANAITGGVRPIHGTVLVRAPRYPKYHYGDRLKISGPLETPPEFDEFSYREYLERKCIYSLLYHPHITRIGSGEGSPFWSSIYTIKDRARNLIARLVPEPEASLLQGILLGIESGIPPELYEDYNTTGTSHIIVISGANITILAAFFSLTLGRLFGKRRAYWFTIAGITVYVLLVGADAAVVRAGVMGGLLVTAVYLGRRATAHVSLLASAMVLTAINPLALWDAGFQLSFAATLGIILFAPDIEQLFEMGLGWLVPQQRAHQIVRVLNDVLIVTLAAMLLTVPLVVYHFGRLSVVSPLANLLILPAQPAIMTLGGAATLMGLVPILEPVAQAIAWVPWLGLAYTNAIVRWLADWPSASIEIDPSGAGWLIAYYAAVAAAIVYRRRRRVAATSLPNWVTSRRSLLVGTGLLLVVTVLAWLAVLQLPDGKLHVAFLDVGQGDAILITAPTGQQILVDSGPSPAALTTALSKEMPFWDRSIDAIVMTHPDADHIAGLPEVLHRFHVDAWLDGGPPNDDALYAECLKQVEEKGVARHILERGSSLELDGGLVLEVLHPPAEPLHATMADANSNSVVLRVSWDEVSFLLTGDIEAEAEHQLVASSQLLAADVLKVSHHGSGDASTAEFLTAVEPSYAVISVGAENRFGHPHLAVLERLIQEGDVTVLRTDEWGTIEFVTDGRQLWLSTEGKWITP
jgi:competence protein ComEC